jgi:hypothetical protein
VVASGKTARAADPRSSLWISIAPIRTWTVRSPDDVGFDAGAVVAGDFAGSIATNTGLGTSLAL